MRKLPSALMVEPSSARTPEKQFLKVVLLTIKAGASRLARFLKLLRSDLEVFSVESLKEFEFLSEDDLREARLIGFGTDVVVPEWILQRLNFGAYNFHPGPPSYPGWAPASFAIYDDAPVFGATAHEMTKTVVAGRIIGTELFPLARGVSPDQLEREAFKAMLRLFRRLGPWMATDPNPPPRLPLAWTGPVRTRAEFRRICELKTALDEEEGIRRRRAFIDRTPTGKPFIQILSAGQINRQMSILADLER